MPGLGGTLSAACALASLLGSASRASAQTMAQGWALNRHEPSVPGDALFLAEHPWYRGTRLVAAGFTLDFAANPLWLRIPRDGLPTLDQAVVSGMLTGHLGVSLAPLRWLGLHLSLPVALQQSGSPIPAGAGNLGPATSMAPGDLRAGLRVRLAGDAARDPWLLHLGALLWLPTGSPSDNTGDGSVRAEARVVVAGSASRLRWSVGAGFHLRSAVSALNLAVGHELRVTAAVAMSLLGGRLDVGPEAQLFSALRERPDRRGSAAFTRAQWGAEVMLGARWRVADPVQVGLAGGIGLGDGYGIPEGRALLTIVYAPTDRAPTPRRIEALPPPTPREEPPVAVLPVAERPVAEAPVAVAPVAAAPIESAPAVSVGEIIPMVGEVEFRTHREAIVGEESFRSLDAVAAALRATPSIEVDVQVHSGHRSNPEFYLELSSRRAQAVREYLIARGIPAARLQSHGMGAACLGRSRRDDDDVPRVQIVLVPPGTPGGRCLRRSPSD